MPLLDNELLRNILEKNNPQFNGKVATLPESRCVAHFDFIPESEETPEIGDCEIMFVGPPNGGNGTYLYKGMDLATFVEFSQASSLGTYFNLYIRNQYSYERVA